MEVSSHRRHEFPVPPDELWATFTRVDRYRAWWPWLRRFDADGFHPGARWACTVQPPLPYTLRFTIELVDVEAPRSVTAVVDGEITGRASLLVEPTETGSALVLDSTLSPANPFLKAVARAARPVVVFGHDWVLDTGLRQFRRRAI